MILRAIDVADPPLHLPLGKLVHETVDRKYEAFRKDMHDWKADALATDFDA